MHTLEENLTDTAIDVIASQVAKRIGLQIEHFKVTTWLLHVY